MTNKEKILVVDDDLNNIAVVEAILYPTYELCFVHNGQEAIDKLPLFMPDLILLDWNMPILNGLDTLKYIRSKMPFNHIQVIMMTAYMTSDEDLLVAYKNGVIDFIRKPFNRLELEARVKSVLQLTRFYKSEVEHKNKKLTSLALQLTQNSEFISDIKTQISEFNHFVCTDNDLLKQKIAQLISHLDIKVPDSIWKQFNQYFLLSNPDFAKNLAHAHPNLSPAEIKLCVLLRLNLDTKQIASILFQNYDSVRVSRSRLRKKLQIESEDNLVGYLTKF